MTKIPQHSKLTKKDYKLNDEEHNTMQYSYMIVSETEQLNDKSKFVITSRTLARQKAYDKDLISFEELFADEDENE